MEKLVTGLTEWLRDKVLAAGAHGLVLGLSGGIDSAVVAALSKRAFPDHSLGLIMPCFSYPQDVEDARLVAGHLGLETKMVVLDEIFVAFLKHLSGDGYSHINDRDLAVANIKPRLRMISLYYFATRNRYLVAGTGNRSEIMIGYFTKHGDGGVDLLPLANLVKGEVWELARYLEVPQRIIDKAPSAGLWEGQTDESEMGLTYQELDHYLQTGDGSEQAKRTVDALHERSKHKREMPQIPPLFS